MEKNNPCGLTSSDRKDCMTDTQEEFPVMDSPNGHHFMHSHSMITTRHFSPILLLNIYGKITINKQEQMTTMVTEKAHYANK